MKTYEETVDWMFSKLPVYQKNGKSALKKDLSRINLLMEKLHYPQNKFKSIHVAGTNGKGSVANMLTSILMEAGYKVGLYTSPHLKDFRERILVNGKPVRKKFITGFISQYKDFMEKEGVTFFEMTVAMALDYFEKSKVDIAVIETGLGGRLDSTNVINPVLSIITNIDYDHTDVLGESLMDIAREKAGIIKPHVPVVIGESRKELLEFFEKICEEKHAEMLIPETDPSAYDTALKGPYQRHNLPVVIEAVNHLRVIGFGISERIIREGLMHVKQNTGFRGRWEIVSERPLIIFDTAHNPAAFEIVMEELNTYPVRKKFFVLSFVQGKDIDKILKLFPPEGEFFISEARIPRAMPKEDLAGHFKKAKLNYRTFDSLQQAYAAAREKAGPDDLIFVGGSTFTVAELI
jgi:dihydrofolate synthase/folylpolyglutamate synthase